MILRGALILLVTAGLFTPACGGSGQGTSGSPVSPTQASTPAAAITGTWSGTIADNSSGAGTVQFVLTESRGRVSGTWTVQFAGASELRGYVTGGLLTTIYVLGLVRDTPPTCSASSFLKGSGSFTMNVTLADANRLTGSYDMVLCDEVHVGTMDLLRQ